ncbi:MAG TPA: tetratricopeptide repeat protein, partial [Thermoanaerobaculia bacterium]
PGAAQVMYARIALARKNPAAAEAHARRALTDPGQALTGSVLLAQAIAEQNRPAEALQLLAQTEQRARAERAMPVESLDSVRGDALARMERFDDAMVAFRRTIAEFPHDHSAYMRAAIVLTVLGKREEADAMLKDMVRRNPTPEARRLAAKARAELGAS